MYDVDLKEAMSLEIPKGKLYQAKKLIKDWIFETVDMQYKELKLNNFISAFGGINVIKLDSWLYNNLLYVGYNLHNMSGLDKLRLYVEDDSAYRKISYLIL